MNHNYLFINTVLKKFPNHFYPISSDLLDIYIADYCLQSKQHKKYDHLFKPANLTVLLDLYFSAICISCISWHFH